MNQSYSFDRAADFYDATRSHPPETVGKITQSILDITHADGATRIFEMGIGTGRISAPLIARGLNVTGLDLSCEMMGKLREKFSPGTPLRLTQGDASALPFPDAAFDVGLASHVFHVISPWRQAIGEMKRVVCPDGLVLHTAHRRRPNSTNVTVRSKWHELVEVHGETWKRPGAPQSEAVTAEFQALGASVEEIEVTSWSGSTTPRQEIADIANRINTDAWAVSDQVMRSTVAELTEWAREQFGSLDAPLPEDGEFTWQVLRFDCAPLLPDPIRRALIRLVPILNGTGARWVLGGSCSLRLHGVPVEPHDIDISTDESGAHRIGQVLGTIGEQKRAVQWSEGQRIRSHYGQYSLGGVQVDVIGAGELREGETWIPARPPAEWDTETIHLPGSELAVAAFALQHELLAYRRMQREEKAKLIEEQLAVLGSR
jgi:ubiquinone/menaquinone biosynthesis C-methylase UbiE